MWAGRKDEPGKYSAAKAGFISGIDVFDPLEFGISVKEAQLMDPSVRMSLEVSHEVRTYPLINPNHPLMSVCVARPFATLGLITVARIQACSTRNY
jgi:hypothetical protein